MHKCLHALTARMAAFGYMKRAENSRIMVRAVVLAEGALGQPVGKTANGLVLHAVNDEIVAVIDSTTAGQDAGEVVAQRTLGIPVVADLEAALVYKPSRLYVGVAPVGGVLPAYFRQIILGAIEASIDIFSGLHSFLGDDPELAAAAARSGATINDIRRAPTDLRVADGRVQSRTTPRLVIMGMDCDMGKRITAMQLLNVARARGLDVGLVATGQTGCMLGPDAGTVIDRVPADFAAGRVESMVCDVSDTRTDLVIIPGQASIQHPAFAAVSLAILHGAAPHAVILQVAPGRTHRILFDGSPFPMGDVRDEIELIEKLGNTRVVALAVNASQTTDKAAAIADLEALTGLPAIDPLFGDADALFDIAWATLQARRVVAA